MTEIQLSPTFRFILKAGLWLILGYCLLRILVPFLWGLGSEFGMIMAVATLIAGLAGLFEFGRHILFGDHPEDPEPIQQPDPTQEGDA